MHFSQLEEEPLNEVAMVDYVGNCEQSIRGNNALIRSSITTNMR